MAGVCVYTVLQKPPSAYCTPANAQHNTLLMEGAQDICVEWGENGVEAWLPQGSVGSLPGSMLLLTGRRPSRDDHELGGR